jgi:hypothetical protein
MAKLGALIDGLYSVEYAVNNLAAPSPTTKKGTSSASYSATQKIQAQLEKPPGAAIKKSGAKIDFYDPELNAILSGEI